MEIFSIVVLVISIVTFIWFSIRLDSIAKNSARTAMATEALLAFHRGDAPKPAPMPTARPTAAQPASPTKSRAELDAAWRKAQGDE